MKKADHLGRWIIGIISIAGLAATFVFQRQDVAGWLSDSFTSLQKFFINRTIRFFLNDLFAIGLILALFPKRRYVIFAVYVQLAGVVFFLLPYFVLKTYFPHYNGPLINFLHRLILNPILLMCLIPAFFYQNSLEK